MIGSVATIRGFTCSQALFKSVRPEAHFLDIAGLQAPNPLLYRCFPLTCARSQE
ncbi:hypothetical protein [Bradyrhizobium brasilense]|uniref:hypothetical protein n=1 Tax=Bradyrhizobium brasilense TaxID=1419277 RepID=UPI0015A26B19|nr:hypothetical protein [Bradyrhizobium brasilense]